MTKGREKTSVKKKEKEKARYLENPKGRLKQK